MLMLFFVFCQKYRLDSGVLRSRPACAISRDLIKDHRNTQIPRSEKNILPRVTAELGRLASTAQYNE